MATGVIVFLVVAYLLIKMLPSPPPAESESALIGQGYSRAQAKREARAQRAEHRSHSRAVGASMRTANRVSRLAVKLSKTR